MTDNDAIVLAESEPDPALLELTEQIIEQIQAGEPINFADYVNRYPQWAGAICKLLPTVRQLVDYGRAVDPTVCVQDNNEPNRTKPPEILNRWRRPL